MAAPVKRDYCAAVERDKEPEAEYSSPDVVAHRSSQLLPPSRRTSPAAHRTSTSPHILRRRQPPVAFPSPVVSCRRQPPVMPPSLAVVVSCRRQLPVVPPLLSSLASSPAFHDLHLKLVSLKFLKKETANKDGDTFNLHENVEKKSFLLCCVKKKRWRDLLRHSSQSNRGNALWVGTAALEQTFFGSAVSMRHWARKGVPRCVAATLVKKKAV
ncbi:hypothetical protein PIB30_026049 [Stylosanthes scabra]|uniref:Uncharacterized protein n=1 Tax=Stylosanthes scabra TaxID=79078 RepID=A0ABU6Z7U0_9FABA|nr:hypothetical protein [Stylosanthes scabra]